MPIVINGADWVEPGDTRSRDLLRPESDLVPMPTHGVRADDRSSFYLPLLESLLPLLTVWWAPSSRAVSSLSSAMSAAMISLAPSSRSTLLPN